MLVQQVYRYTVQSRYGTRVGDSTCYRVLSSNDTAQTTRHKVVVYLLKKSYCSNGQVYRVLRSVIDSV